MFQSTKQQLKSNTNKKIEKTTNLKEVFWMKYSQMVHHFHPSIADYWVLWTEGTFVV